MDAFTIRLKSLLGCKVGADAAARDPDSDRLSWHRTFLESGESNTEVFHKCLKASIASLSVGDTIVYWVSSTILVKELFKSNLGSTLRSAEPNQD